MRPAAKRPPVIPRMKGASCGGPILRAARELFPSSRVIEGITAKGAFKKMKKLFLLLCAVCLMLALAGCGQKTAEEAQGAELENPVTEVSGQELLTKTGISFCLPEGAENAAYSYIDDGEQVIAQLRFTLDGADCAARAVSTGIPGDVLPDISGLYYEWQHSGTGEVGYNSAQLHWNEGEAGHAAWYDYAPGILYSLSMDSGAGRDALLAIAAESCPPMQGEAG